MQEAIRRYKDDVFHSPANYALAFYIHGYTNPEKDIAVEDFNPIDLLPEKYQSRCWDRYTVMAVEEDGLSCLSFFLTIRDPFFLQETLEVMDYFAQNPLVYYAFPSYTGGIMPLGNPMALSGSDPTRLEDALTFFDEDHHGLEEAYSSLLVCLTLEASEKQDTFAYGDVLSTGPQILFPYDVAEELPLVDVPETEGVDIDFGARKWVEISFDEPLQADHVFTMIKFIWRDNQQGVYYAIPKE